MESKIRKWLRVFAIGILAGVTQTVFGADIILNSCTKINLPAIGTAGRLYRITDDVRGVWIDNGTEWVKVVPFVMASDFGFSTSATAANNKTALTNALTAARNSNAYKTVKMPGGVFNIDGFTFPGTGPIASDSASQNIGLVGAGNGYTTSNLTSPGPATILKFASGVTSGQGSAATYGIYLDNYKTAYNFFEDFQINGNSNIDYGLRVISACTVSRVASTNCNLAGFRGQTLDSTHMYDICAVGNNGDGMLIDIATAQDGVNTTQNTTTIISGGIFSGNGGKGLTIKQLTHGKILGSVFQGNTSFGVYLYQLTAIPGPSFIEFEQLWFENNGGVTDLYQIKIDSQSPTDPANVPNDTVFRNCAMYALGSQKAVSIQAAQRVEFTETTWFASTPGTIDLGANASGVVFKNRINGTVNNSGANNFDIRVLTGNRAGYGVTGYGSNPAFFSADGGFLERGRTTPLGEWITPAYNAGDFTGSGSMTWTVDSADRVTHAYTLIGKTMTVMFQLKETSIGGTLNSALQIAIPGGLTSAKTADGLYQYSNGSAYAVGSIIVSAGDTKIKLYKGLQGAGGNWGAATNTTWVHGQITFEVQ